MPPRKSARLWELSKPVPAPQPVDFVSADLNVEFPHGNEMRQRGHFVLRSEDDARVSNRIEEAEFFDFRKALSQMKFSIAIDTRVRDRLIERYFRRPLRDGIVALAAFIQPDVHGMYFVQRFRRVLHKQVCQAGRHSGIDQRHTVFPLEFLCIAELLGLEGMASQVRTEIDVMRAQPQRGPQHNLVKHRGRSVDDELATLRGLHDPAQVSRVYFRHPDGASLAYEAPRALRI